jgi:endo-1,4-beta-xylanase
MNIKRFMVISGGICLVSVLVFIWGCQNQPTGPEVANPLSDPGTKFRSYQSGTHDGYFWSLWTDDGSGSVNYSNGSDGNYSVSWNYNGNFTCGKGWSSGSKTRVVGYNCGSYSQSGGGGSFAYYGWCRNPLMEYYVNEKWPGSRPASGSSLRTVSSDGGTYNVYTAWRSNAPSIDGTQSFRQIYSTRTSQNSTGENHTITFANHANAWSAAGYGLGSDMSPAAILLTEAWGNSSGNVNATVWEGGGGGGSTSTTTTTTTTSGGSTTTTTSGGGGGSNTIVVRARGVAGSEHIYVTVDGNQIGSWTLSTSYNNYSASTNNTGGINVCFDNDDGENRDVQIDYITVNGSTRQAEDQSYNTGVWQDGECGGGDGHSEWLHCEGCIGFGDVSGGGGGGSTSTTTTSGSSWWGGGSWW